MAATGALALAEGKAPPNATRLDWDHKTFSLDPAFAMNVRVAVHPLAPMSRLTRRATTRKENATPYASSPRAPTSTSHRDNRSAFQSQSANELLAGPPPSSTRTIMSPGAAGRHAWGAQNATPAAFALSVCGTLIPDGEWRHAGKHQCSRCHARDQASRPTSPPPPFEGVHASAPPRIHEPKCSFATPWPALRAHGALR